MAAKARAHRRQPQRLPQRPPAANESKDQEQQQRANSGVDDRGDNARAKVDVELGQQPPTDEGAYDADDEVVDDPVSGASDNLARQPSGNEADR